MAESKKISACFSEQFLSVIESQGQTPVSSFQMPIVLTQNSPADSLISSLSDSLAFADLLQKNIVQHHIFTKQVHLALPSRDVIVRWFVIPMMQLSEISLAIEFEVKKYLPFAMQDLVYHYTTTPRGEKSSQQLNVFFVAIKKTTFESYLNLFSQVGLSVFYSEPAAVSLLRILAHNKKLSLSKRTAVVSIVNEQCDLFITYEGKLLLTRDFKLSLQGDVQISEAQQNIKTKLFNEIRLSLESFLRLEETQDVEHILLVSDQVEMDFSKQLQDDLNITTQMILINDLTQSLGMGLDFVGALGVGLSGAVKNILDLNICQGEGGNQPKQPVQQARSWLNIPPVLFPIIAGIGSAIVIALVLAGFEGTILLKKTQINHSKQKLSQYAEISLQELKNKESLEEVKNKSFTSLTVHTNQAFLLTRLISLMPQGIAFEALDLNFQERKAGDRRRGETAQKTNYTPLTNQKTLKITAYAYLNNSNEEVKKINEYLASLREDVVFSKIFSTIQLGTLKVNRKNDQSVTSFTLECQ